ncbi:MAG TPA: carboxylesterase/lipase family protein [Acidimicrobiales bacterium]|nr:carboxylesterase/lipase family protein [Acidimicrobiales bacterium]
MTATLVETSSGKVVGTQIGPVIQWRGIPYAAPPIGPRRFLPPSPPEPWARTRDATRFGPAAIQPYSPVEAMFRTSATDTSEDCLYLNVFATPPDGARRPVMVWIHGGSFVSGSGSTGWYDGSTFAAAGDVVVVTINYRLGLLGFLHLAEVAGERYPWSGNCGILDQVAALEWVRDNIEAFGGDPGRVTVFGESAGAMSIGTLLAMPAAAGLSQAAILQSGSTSAHRSRTQADNVTRSVLTFLGVGPGQLADVPVAKLLEAQLAVSGGAQVSGYLAFQPVVDGTSLPTAPSDAIAAGSAAGVRVLAGSNRDEMTLFLAFDSKLADLDRPGLLARGAALVDEETAERLVDGYMASRPGASPAELLSAMSTDMLFRVPAIRLAEAQAASGTPVWMYRFDWATPAFGGVLKATHALEIPFMWNIISKPGVELFTGSGPGRQALADRMQAAWLAFARTGDPATPLLPDWPGYEPTRRATMIFDDTCRTEHDPAAAERLLWDGVI